MSNLAAKLKSLKLELAEDLIDKWSLSQFISHCMQEEEKLQRDKIESVHFASTSQNKKRKNIKDDYSKYGYLYLIHEKSQSLYIFKSFKAEVELQLGKKIKAIKSDCGGEYYGRYDGSKNNAKGLLSFFSKSLTKPLMNFGLAKSRMSNICTFRVVQLKYGPISRMKENWIQELLDVTLVAMLNALEL
ncbi:hypothetical protein CR513_19936, partial [Mucuna pruriens]